MHIRHFIALAAALLATPALADSHAGDAAVKVHYADLDLNSRAGLAKLDQRIRDAARLVCGATTSTDPKGENKAIACRNAALTVARAQRASILAAARPQGVDQLAQRH